MPSGRRFAYGRYMAEHPNARTLRRFYACFGEADYLARVRDFLAPQVVWHIAGANPLAGQLHGIDAVTEQMRRYSDLSAGTLRLDTSIMASDTHAVAIHRARAAVADAWYDTHEVDVFHIDGNLITEFWSFSEDQEATDRLWRVAVTFHAAR
jgi:limonene-1,2-epoxide hydrolase